MGNRVEIEFIATDRGVVATTKNIADNLPLIERNARPVSSALDALIGNIQVLADRARMPLQPGFLDELKTKGISTVQAYTEQLRALYSQQVNVRAISVAAASAERQLNQERDAAIQKTARLAEANERLAQQIAAQRRAAAPPDNNATNLFSSVPTRGGAVQTPSGVSRQALASSRQLEQTRLAAATQRATQLTDEQFQSMQRLDGAARRAYGGTEAVRSALLRISGIPQSEAVGGIIQLGAAGTGPALAVAAVVAGVAVWLEKIIQIRKEQEKIFKDAAEGSRKFAEQGNLGGRGNLFLSEADEKTNKVRDFLRDLDKGRALGVSPDTLTLTEQIKKLTDGAARNENDLRALSIILNESQRNREAREFSLDPRAAGNRFAEAQRRFEGFAGDRISIQQINQELGSLKEQYLSGAISLEDYNRSLDKFERELKQSAEIGEQAKKGQENFKNSVDSSKAALEQINNLRSQVQNNPFVTLYDEAAKRQRSFLDQFKDVVPQIKEQFVELNKQVLSLDIFKANLARNDRLNGLIAQADQLRNGFGGLDRVKEIGQQRESFVGRHFDLEQEGRALRGQQFSEADSLRRRVAELQSSLSGRFAAEAVEQATRGVSGDLLDAAGVRNARIGALDTLASKEREDFIRQQRVRQLEDDSRARQITSAQDALSRAQGPAQQSLALDRLLEATSEIGKLTDSQIDLRLRALEQKIAIEPSADQAKQAREEKQAEAQENFTKALVDFTKALAQGIGFDIKVSDSDSTKTDLGVSPGADTLFGPASNFMRGLGGGFTNNF